MPRQVACGYLHLWWTGAAHSLHTLPWLTAPQMKSPHLEHQVGFLNVLLVHEWGRRSPGLAGGGGAAVGGGGAAVGGGVDKLGSGAEVT